MDSLVVVEIMVLVSTVLYRSLILRGRRQKPRGGGQEKTEYGVHLRTKIIENKVQFEV